MMDFSQFPVTLLIIAANFALSVMSFNNSHLMGKLIFHPPAVATHRQWYRFLTSGFIHKDWNHLLLNMITLFFFGQSLEPVFYLLGLGRPFYLFFYLSAIIVSEIPSFLKHRNNDRYYSLGASGAVSAVVFSLVLFSPWETIYIKFLIPVPFILFAVGYLAYSAYMDKKGNDNIGHSAHLWGALYGVIFMLLAYPRSLDIFLDQIRHPHWF